MPEQHVFDFASIDFEDELYEKVNTLVIMAVEQRGLDGALSLLTDIITIAAHESPKTNDLINKAYEMQTGLMRNETH